MRSQNLQSKPKGQILGIDQILGTNNGQNNNTMGKFFFFKVRKEIISSIFIMDFTLQNEHICLLKILRKKCFDSKSI